MTPKARAQKRLHYVLATQRASGQDCQQHRIRIRAATATRSMGMSTSDQGVSRPPRRRTPIHDAGRRGSRASSMTSAAPKALSVMVWHLAIATAAAAEQPRPRRINGYVTRAARIPAIRRRACRTPVKILGANGNGVAAAWSAAARRVGSTNRLRRRPQAPSPPTSPAWRRKRALKRGCAAC